MNDKEILEKVLQKAIDGGYNHIPYSVTEHADFLIETKVLPILIFNHDFAKALWGEEETVKHSHFAREITKHGWEYHLKAMVISDNPIQYLKENI